MKRIVLTFLLLFSSLAVADDMAVERYIYTQVHMKQTEISQLHKAINLLNNKSLTDQEKFELIGQPTFSAIEQALSAKGYTIRTYYQFAEDNKAEINLWLEEYEAEAKQIDALDLEKESLIEEYDRLNKDRATKY